MKLVSVDPLQDAVWTRLIASSPLASLFHAPEWIACVSSVYGFEPRAFVLLSAEDVPIGGIHLCTINDIRGERVVSFPFSDFADPLAPDIDTWRALFAPISDEIRPFYVRALHSPLPAQQTELQATKQTAWHALNISPELDHIWMQIDESARRAIRKAQRMGVTVRPAETISDWRAFFAFHLDIRRRKYSLLAQPFAFFLALKEQFVDKGRGVLLLAEVEGRVIGSVLYLGWKDTLTYKFSASDLDALAYRPTDLLIWEGVRYAKDRGYRIIDFGASDLDQPGLIRFKRKYADSEKHITFLRYIPDGYVASPREFETSAVLGALTALLTKDSVPAPIAEEACDLLYRFFA
jgi:CelD/BcsL family acetyltransferase involved in cellulose biosynthesis